MKLIPEAMPQSSGDLFLQVAGTTQLTGDSTQNIVFPRPPGTVVISGTVTDSAGIPVANAAVSTSTAEVSGVPMTGFTRSTQTDAMGNYSLTVLSGTNYDMIFHPPTTRPSATAQGNPLLAVPRLSR